MAKYYMSIMFDENANLAMVELTHNSFEIMTFAQHNFVAYNVESMQKEALKWLDSFTIGSRGFTLMHPNGVDVTTFTGSYSETSTDGTCHCYVLEIYVMSV